MGFRQKAKVKREEKYVYLTSLGNAINFIVFTKHFWGYGSKIRASQRLNPNLTEFFNPLN